MRSTPKSQSLLAPLTLLSLALALASLLVTPGVAHAGSSRAGATPRTSASASTAIARTLARHGLAANIAAEVTSMKIERVGLRTEVRCEIRVVVAASADTINPTSTATVRGRGRYAKSGRVNLARARAACTSSVAEELAASKIVPFLRAQ